jgi:uncharacterized protein YdhG (YjbR/CyaY superfamily)
MSDESIARYAAGAPPDHAAVCRLLRSEIDRALPKATSKIWHAMPVWFVGENPVVGYKVTAKHVNLLFWNGQAFGETALTAAGSFKAAQIKFTDVAQVDARALRRWLKLAGTKVWDFQGMRTRARAGTRATHARQ